MTSTGVFTAADRARGLLAGVGLGDALGAEFEGSSRISETTLHESESARHRLRYTDDTALTIAVAEHLLERAEQGGPVLREAELASDLATRWSREPWRGYGAAAVTLFERVSTGTPWNEAADSLFHGDGSFGNGGAMRCSPVALVARSAHQAAELGRRSASVTHAHPDGQHGAAIQACGAYLALHTRAGDEIDTHAFLDHILRNVHGNVHESRNVHESEWQERLRRVGSLVGRVDPSQAAAELGNDVRATHSVPLALWAFLSHPFHPDEVVRQCIRAGGDTDTIASMAGALAGALHGSAAWTPTLLRRLEDGKRLNELADRLLAHAASGADAVGASDTAQQNAE